MKHLVLVTLAALPLACSAEPTDAPTTSTTSTTINADVKTDAATVSADASITATAEKDKPAAPKKAERPKKELIEGFHYVRLKQKQPVATGDKIEVVEVFSYSCGHCNALDPFVQDWKETKADDVGFVYVPAVTPNWGIYAKMHHTAAALGKLDELHPLIFKEIHRKRNKLNTPSRIQKFFAKHGVSKNDFYKHFNSFSTSRRLAKGKKQMNDYEMDSVPMLIVGGEYKVLNTGAQTRPEFMEIVDALVDKVRQEKAAK